MKSKLPPCSGSATLRQLNPVHEKGARSFFNQWKLRFWLLKENALSSVI